MSFSGQKRHQSQNMEFDDYEGYELIAARMRILLPNSWFRASWDWVLIMLVLYNLIVIPLDICFLVETTIPLPVQVFNIWVDLFFIIDLFLNFRTAYFDGAALSPVIEPSLIAKHYLFGSTDKRGVGWFWPDAFAAIPFDWVPTTNISSVQAVSIAKLGRLFRIGRLIKKLDQFTAARAVRVVNLLIVLLLCTHFMACFWWKIGMDTPDDLGWPLRTEVAAVLLEVDVSPASDDPFLYYVDDSTAMLNLTHLRQRIEDDVDIPKKYITSLYWALTMVMKSPWLPPRMVNEQLFASITVVIAAMLFAGFIGTFTGTIASYDKSNAVYRDATGTRSGRAHTAAVHCMCVCAAGTLRLFFKTRPHISYETKRRAFRYADAYFKQTIGGMSELSVLASLPEHLRSTVMLELHKELLSASSWLQETSYACCSDFLLALKPEILLRGDKLLNAGVISKLFYIFISGEIQLSFAPDGSQVSKLGSLLGEGEQALSTKQRTSKRVPQHRIERLGSLIGWGPPHGVALPLAYSATGARDSSLLSISRARLGEILETHPMDAACFQRASEHATKTINPVKKNSVVAEGASPDGAGAGLAARRRCSTMDAMKQEISGAVAGGKPPRKGSSMNTPNGANGGAGGAAAEDALVEAAVAEARQAGWLKGAAAKVWPGAGGGLGTSPAVARAMAAGTTDEKLEALFEEVSGIKEGLAQQMEQMAQLMAMLKAKSNGLHA